MVPEAMISSPCNFCGFVSSSLAEYTNHSQSHRDTCEDNRPFLCGVCHKGFKSKGHLKAHMVTHTKEKPFQCKVCFKRFGLKWNMRSHMILHERDNNWIGKMFCLILLKLHMLHVKVYEVVLQFSILFETCFVNVRY